MTCFVAVARHGGPIMQQHCETRPAMHALLACARTARGSRTTYTGGPHARGCAALRALGSSCALALVLAACSKQASTPPAAAAPPPAPVTVMQVIQRDTTVIGELV